MCRRRHADGRGERSRRLKPNTLGADSCNANHVAPREHGCSMAEEFTSPPRRRRPPPAEVCLLLRSHAEAQWLTTKLVPLVRELEEPGGHPRNHMGDPYAYLEALWIEACGRAAETDGARVELEIDRKSTRLNSSHLVISYAVFCLKKKK